MILPSIWTALNVVLIDGFVLAKGFLALIYPKIHSKFSGHYATFFI